MKTQAELPADLLGGPLAPSQEPEDASSATRITRIAQLAERGEHPAAARESAELIQAGLYDIRLIGYYLFGLFLERGVAHLPALLGRLGALVADQLEVLRPERRKLQIVNSATAWLFENVSARLQFHTKQRDATWDAWRDASDAALADAIASGCAKVTAALEAVIDTPLAAGPLARVRRWAGEDLRRALSQREAAAERAAAAAATAAAATAAPAAAAAAATAAPAPAGSPDDDPDGAGDDLDDGALDDDLDGADDLDPPEASASHRAPVGERPAPAAATAATAAADEVVVVGSPAVAVLQAKLRGFQDLVARGELAKAAVVAADVRQTLASFDPIEYFPSLFADYFKILHMVIEDLAPYLDRAGDPSWDALRSYYRADMRAFFEE